MTNPTDLKQALEAWARNSDEQPMQWCDGASEMLALVMPVIEAAEDLNVAFARMSEKQWKLLGEHGDLVTACENWEEATSEPIDFAPLMAALTQLKERVCGKG